MMIMMMCMQRGGGAFLRLDGMEKVNSTMGNAP